MSSDLLYRAVTGARPGEINGHENNYFRSNILLWKADFYYTNTNTLTVPLVMITGMCVMSIFVE
jgi:hypothetical protein